MRYKIDCAWQPIVSNEEDFDGETLYSDACEFWSNIFNEEALFLFNTRLDWSAKHYYNAFDLNAVEANTEYFAGWLKSNGSNVNLPIVNKNRSWVDLDRSGGIDNAEQNIHRLALAFSQPPEYEQPRVWSGNEPFTWKDALRLERNLALLFEWYRKAEIEFVYCGEFFAGEEVI